MYKQLSEKGQYLALGEVQMLLHTEKDKNDTK